MQSLDKNDPERFSKLGIATLLDVALLLPHSYESTVLSPTPFLEQINTLHVKILSIKSSPKVMQIQLYCEAWERQLEGVIFAPRPYHKALFKKEGECYVSGKVHLKGMSLQMVQPKIVTTINSLTPKYKTVLQNKTLLSIMSRYLNLESLLNEGLSLKESETLLKIHFPKVSEVTMYEASFLEKQKALLKFVEIFNYLKKLSLKKVRVPSSLKLEGDEKPFVKSLPFTLTLDQQSAIAEIKKDFLGKYAAKRVVMGDVGCGKTMVILSCVMMAYPYKSVLMAPTTVLAKQLFEEAKKYLPLHVRSVLITQEGKDENDLEGVDFIIGTHALLYRELPDCALVMVDEQHRFGTNQRALLASLVTKSKSYPHYVQFSATPIPRTLSMIQSSLVDFSFIKMLPFPKDISTKLISKQAFKGLLEHIKHEISLNHQCIIVYPLVEESETINYQSIEEGRAFWEKNFEKVYVTHGRDKHKEAVLESFKNEGNVLISTTVVEVGLSLPKLSTIVIVGAERLGLASLHQLRGRVSRNGLKGYCFLYTHATHPSERLEAFSKTLDGFEIAELDLRFRQGGDIVGGSLQSGKKFVWFDMVEDEGILKEAKERVLKIKEESLRLS